MRKLSVVIYDNEREEYEAFRPRFQLVFSNIGYDANIEYCQNRRELDRAMKTHPDVVICDAEFGPEASIEGLQRIADLAPLWPHVIFVLYTKREISVDDLGAFTPNPRMIIDKACLGDVDDGYRRYVSTEFRSMLNRAEIHKVNFVDDFGKELEYDAAFRNYPSSRDKPRPDLATVQALCSLVTFTGHQEGPHAGAPIAWLRPLKGGYSGAAVFEMTLEVEGRPVGVPVILKISSRRSTEIEYINYCQYVKWYLPYSWRVDVMGVGFTKEHGAICYSVVLNGVATPNPVRHFLRRHDTAAESVDLVMKTIFNENNKTWYSDHRDSQGDITEHYKVVFPRMSKMERRKEAENVVREVFERSGKTFLTNRDCYFIGNRGVRNPRQLLHALQWGRYRECICHGDLHGNNVMCSLDRRAIGFIDFQKTGYAHCFLDFITFETSLRLDFLHYVKRRDASQIEDFIAMERNLLNSGWVLPDQVIEPYLAEVHKVRRAAHVNFEDQPFYQYVYALTTHTWNMIPLQKWDDLRLFRLVGMLIAGLEWLGDYRSRDPDALPGGDVDASICLIQTVESLS